MSPLWQRAFYRGDRAARAFPAEAQFLHGTTEARSVRASAQNAREATRGAAEGEPYTHAVRRRFPAMAQKVLSALLRRAIKTRASGCRAHPSKAR